ncbi:flagellar basal body rod modification protein [Thioclava dalianensis]|uniref:Basal-body rod modification protein FlgD n=1 Tax=Thioclava dalianensis TaxID=1185766 RepID=A0A074TF71_9RHOB|nr:flagellar hook capping FlgD N-terminal domain-containing protein [Thioclava dalianensis]KEP70391.1 flagellar basal body rod modification protein [Thioclava dalianensis]SFN31934.1 flagellar basal-body rod modification protein FlgD [Thioclava dalianensis]
MTTIPATGASQSTSASSNAEKPAKEATPQISADFETFLTMLTVQMKNQDPLNPIESTDYAVQLATFSGVEQQVKTNDLIANLATHMNASGMSGLAGWVGMEARAAAPAWFDGAEPVSLAPKPATGADQVVLVVRDADGTEVSREAIAPTSDPLQWSGTTANGDSFPAGLYSFSLESYKDETLLSTKTVETYGRVTEAQLGASGPELILQGGARVMASEVSALREA